MADLGVCIVAPPKRDCTERQTAWVAAVRRLAEDRGATVTIFRTVAHRSERRDEGGRSLQILEPWDADQLYKLIHRGSFAVFQAGPARARLNPLDSLSSVSTAALSRFVRYKAYFAQCDEVATSDRFAEFDLWVEQNHIDTPRDCRVLPLHMFSPRRDWAGLAPEQGREEFARSHGRPTKLTDTGLREWKQPTALHGKDELLVANYPLPTGYHWDVNAAKTTTRLASLIEIWRFERGSYANVSPDGHIRGGQRSGISARREGTAPRPPKPPAEPKAESGRRRRRKPDGKR